MQHADQGAPNLPSAGSFKLAIVQARFNANITQVLAQSAYDELIELGVLPENITTVQVAGALEIPLALQALAKQKKYDAFIALGCIVRGETYHFELVANESAAGITRVGLEHHIPIANAVLTTENMAQANARKVDKGREAAQAAVELAHLLKSLTP